MQKKIEIEQGVPEIWGLKGSEMILLRETEKRKNTTVHGQATATNLVYIIITLLAIFINDAYFKKMFALFLHN